MAKSKKKSPATGGEGLRQRLSRRGEDAIGKLAEDLVDNRVVGGAVQVVLDAREKASQVQEGALGALNLPTGSDLERLTRRLRLVSQRLEGVEDGIDRLEDRLNAVLERASNGGRQGGGESVAAVLERLGRLETRLDELVRDLAAVKQALPPGPEPVPRTQERFAVRESF